MNPEDDEPLLSPGRIVRAVRWWVWWNWSDTIDHDNQIHLSLWTLIKNYRRSYANRENY